MGQGGRASGRQKKLPLRPGALRNLRRLLAPWRPGTLAKLELAAAVGAWPCLSCPAERRFDLRPLDSAARPCSYPAGSCQRALAASAHACTPARPHAHPGPRVTPVPHQHNANSCCASRASCLDLPSGGISAMWARLIRPQHHGCVVLAGGPE